MNRPAALLVGAGCVALAACAGSRAEVRPVYRPSREGLLACELKAPAAIRLGDSLPVTMTIRNVGRGPLRVLTTGTPLMGIAVKDSYDVTCDGRRVEYTHGIVVNLIRWEVPPPSAYQALPPGGETSGTLDLAKLYAIAPGRCTIHYRGGEVGDAIDDPTMMTRPRSEFQGATFHCPDLNVDVAR